MDMLNDSLSTVGPDIPLDGLCEVLSRWSGIGYLYEALAIIHDDSGRDWRPVDIEERAHRILLSRLAPSLELLPTHEISWLEILPLSSLREKFLADSPGHGVSWRESRRYGWPPRHFVGRIRSRHFSRELVESLSWTLGHLTRSWKLVHRSDATFPSIYKQVRICEQVLGFLNSQGIEPVSPNSIAMVTLRQEGRVWRIIERVAAAYLALTETPVTELAHELIWPDPEIRGRLFHLAVLGKLLLEIRKAGGTLLSTNPIREFATRPVYSLSIAGEQWDVWFEASGVWRHHGFSAPYTVAMQGVDRRVRPLSPDILLLRRPDRAVVLECKHSAKAEYVCQGYAQASAYANEVGSLLATEVEALVVGPRDVVTRSSTTATRVGTLGAISPEHMSEVVARLLRPRGQ